jgi:isoquinoline 1-oxidoreductase beta subunit
VGDFLEKMCHQNGKVIHPDGRSSRYGQLTEAAGKRPVPEKPALKNPKDYKIIGTPRERMDIPDKVMGRTVYGMDFTLPDMCIAVVARPPFYGASPNPMIRMQPWPSKGWSAVIPLRKQDCGMCRNDLRSHARPGCPEHKVVQRLFA